jgi:hypothetical protein
MSIQDLLNAGVPSDAELSVMAFDWYPKVPMQVPHVVDANTGSTTNIQSPCLVVFGGPNAFNRFDNSGYSFTQQYVKL